MAKNIIVIVGSPRQNGNTEILADAFIKGAESSGNIVKKIALSGLKINGCLACSHCSSNEGQCIQKDDMQNIYPELWSSDMVVFATPLYFSAMSSQIKAVIDRFFVMTGKKFSATSSALLVVCQDSNPAGCDPVIANYIAMSEFMEWENKGIIIVPGVDAKGDINSHKDVLDKAEQLGASV